MISEAGLPCVSVIFLFYLENWAFCTAFCFSRFCMNLWVFEKNTNLPVICVKRGRMPIMDQYHKPVILYFYVCSVTPTKSPVYLKK